MSNWPKARLVGSRNEMTFENETIHCEDNTWPKTWIQQTFIGRFLGQLLEFFDIFLGGISVFFERGKFRTQKYLMKFFISRFQYRPIERRFNSQLWRENQL